MKAITKKEKSSLFAAGIVKVEGSFNQNQCVKIKTLLKQDGDEKIIEIGKGIVNYSSIEINRLIGAKSSEIFEILGYVESEFIINRDNLAIYSSFQNKELKS